MQWQRSRDLIVLALLVCGVVDTWAQTNECEGWNTRAFFDTATAKRVVACAHAGADPNARGDGGLGPMHYAAALSDAEVVIVLLEAGGDPNIRGPNGATPLMLASEAGKPDTVMVLLEAGARPNDRADNGLTSLHVAARVGRSEVVDALLSAGADPNVSEDELSATPLHLAASALSRSSAESLLKAGADPNARTDGGYTPLHVVVMGQGFWQWANIATELLEAGADPNARDDDGDTVLKMIVGRVAYDGMKPEAGDFVALAVTVLLDAGADPSLGMDGASEAWIEGMVALLDVADPKTRVVGHAPRFGDGTHIVGTNIEPGTYRNAGGRFCYWARLSGFSGEFDDILANGTLEGVSGVVTIKASDTGFNSQGCGNWYLVTATTGRQLTRFGDGTHIVGADIRAGTYRNTGGEFCYWERLSGFSGDFDEILANGTLEGVSGVVTVKASDRGFSSQGCGRWQAVQ